MELSVTLATEEDLAEAECELGVEDGADPREMAISDNLVQRQADQRLLEHLAAKGFTGIMWDYFSNELAAYAVPVLLSWMRSRKICRLCAERGRPIPTPPPSWSTEDQHDLATLTVAKSINLFRDRVLRPGRWDAARGTTIKTYFMGTVILQFPNYYNSWFDKYHNTLDLLAYQELDEIGTGAADRSPSSGTDPAAEATNRVHLLQVLERMPADLRTACLLMWQGHTVTTAAEAIGKSCDALSEQLRRFRNGRGRGMK